MNFVISSILYLAVLSSVISANDPDEHRTVLELISTKGYPAEEHHVPTDDGYVLTMHRIRGGRNEKVDLNAPSKKPAVYLQHGLLDSSATWVVNSPEQSLGFILADQGFDVWMGNSRGNTFGMGHKTLKSSDPAFWDFSWDDMAKHDLPSMVNYVLHHTKQADLFYIGHSQGTMTAFSGLSENQELASKIKLFCALGPVATIATIQSPIKVLSNIGSYPDHDLIYRMFGRKDFMPSSLWIRYLAETFCNNVVTTPLICDNIIFLFTGPSKNLNNSRIAVYTNHAPAGTSVKNIIHYAQSVENKKFQKFDYGKLNPSEYNQTVAPEYDVTKLQVPVALYWAKNDWLADPEDVNFLRKNVPKVVDDLDCKDYNHLDYLWATNAREVFYDRMIRLMKTYL